MNKPRIGLISFVSRSTPKHFAVQLTYVNAILDNGGIPVLFPVTEHTELCRGYMDSVDGLLLPGGEDINPLVFGEDPVPQVNYMNRIKDYFEIELIKEARAQKKPILGICRGHQIINAALGGTLYQDIPTQFANKICHSQAQEIRDELTHRVNLEAGTRIREIFGQDVIEVNSYHHQAVREPAPCMKVTARAADGLIEAMESDDGLILSVQWHPEALYKRYPAFSGLFRDLIEKASRR